MGSIATGLQYDPQAELKRRQLQAILMGAQQASSPQLEPSLQVQAPQYSPGFHEQTSTPVPITPPKMQELQSYIPTEPKLSEYHPSLGRRIAGAVGKYVAPMVPGAQLLERPLQEAEYAPYTKEHKGWEQGLAQRELAAKEEQTTAESQAKIGHEVAQSAAEKERAIAEAARAEAQRRRGEVWAPHTEQEAIDVAQAKIRPPTPHVTLDTSRGKAITVDPADPTHPKVGQYAPPRPTPDPEAMENLRFQHQKILTNIKASLRAAKDPSTKDKVSVASQLEADKLALQHIYSTHPEHADLIDPKTWTVKSVTQSRALGIGPQTTKPSDPKRLKALNDLKDQISQEIQRKSEGKSPKKFEFEEENPYEVTVEK